MITIEDNIPIPPRGLRGPVREAANAMLPGQSFVLNDENQKNALLSRARADGMRLTSRKLEKGGWRIWRIK